METLQSDQSQGQQAKRACLSCQRRRRWCDKTLPRCHSCARAQRKCEGYAPDVIRTFVNMTATDVCSPNKKRLLCEALTRSRDPPTDVFAKGHQPSTKHEQIMTVLDEGIGGMPSIVDLQPDFRQHLEALWSTFISAYCRTEDYWPPGCSWLALRNRPLDLALIAISAQRLTLFSLNSRLHLLGLEAYNESIRLYLSMMQKQMDSWSTALLAVTSTLYALMEASLMQPHDIVSFGWGNSGHFDGALELTMRSGPEIFATAGFHLVFKKVREMGLFLALSRRKDTFLHADDWMVSPWVYQHKTWRDKLHDLAIRFSAISASLTLCRGSHDASNQIPGVFQIEADLGQWRSSWLKEAHTGVAIQCVCYLSTPLSCICSVPAQEFPTIEFGLLQIECWSLQLIISTALNDLAVNRPEWMTRDISDLPLRSSQIASQIEAANNFYAASRPTDQSSGITEDVCRMIFPLWALKEYRDKR